MQQAVRESPAIAMPAPVIHQMPSRPPKEIVQRYLALDDLSSTVSDALDELGIRAAVPGTVLRPIIPTAKVAGPALTVRNVPRREQAHVALRTPTPPVEGGGAHGHAQPGDVIVIESVPLVSNMGAMSARSGLAKGEAATIVEGGIRDAAALREMGYPVWCRDITPITMRGRIQTIEINGPVVVGGVLVMPGDLVVADEDGVCFVPAQALAAVLEKAEEIDAREGSTTRR